MNLNQLKEKDLFGRVYIQASDDGNLRNYFCSLKAIYALVRSKEWEKIVTGYYINHVNKKYYGSVRLSYFTHVNDNANEVVKHYVAEKGLKIIKNPEEIPYVNRISDGYGGEELRFRRFLSIYTLIGLDIMEANLLHARCLFATFRWQIMRARRPYTPHFLKFFENQSPFYNGLSSVEKDRFWRDMKHWPNHPQVDWAHLFVNMVLWCDWDIREFLSQKSPLSISEINRILKQCAFGFQIRENWHP